MSKYAQGYFDALPYSFDFQFQITRTRHGTMYIVHSQQSNTSNTYTFTD